MPAPPRRTVGISEEIDVGTNPRFVERQRNRYAARGVALIILINSIAAIALLVGLAHGAASGQNLKGFADAMMVFGVGAAAGLASIFLCLPPASLSVGAALARHNPTPLACHCGCNNRGCLLRLRTRCGA
jgi:hypothetical protein